MFFVYAVSLQADPACAARKELHKELLQDARVCTHSFPTIAAKGETTPKTMRQQLLASTAAAERSTPASAARSHGVVRSSPFRQLQAAATSASTTASPRVLFSPKTEAKGSVKRRGRGGRRGSCPELLVIAGQDPRIHSYVLPEHGSVVVGLGHGEQQEHHASAGEREEQLLRKTMEASPSGATVGVPSPLREAAATPVRTPTHRVQHMESKQEEVVVPPSFGVLSLGKDE